MIDPGHGGDDIGAAYDERQKYDGLREKDFNLGVALYLELMARMSGHQVKMIRDKDEYVSLQDRVQIAETYLPDCFVSIHADAYPGSPVEGHAVYHHADDASGELLAQSLSQGISEFFPGHRNRGIKTVGFHVLTHNPAPAALIECGFVSTKVERLFLKAPQTQYRYALAIINAINIYLQEVEK